MNNTKKCVICRTCVDDPLNLGEMKTYDNITAHYYCLLLASTIKQSGEDEEGILGFLPTDIKDEVLRSEKRECNYCRQKGAAVLCSHKSCKIMFHLPCGIKNDSGHQFHGRFMSTCRTHRPRQKFKRPPEPQKCPICYEYVNFKVLSKILWAPCCKKQSFFHKTCIQQMALSAGYFFKCPMCNNCDVFQKAMKHHGVFIPDRDASWELEPNAFEELLYRHTECNVPVCLCKGGRKYDNLGPWNITLCGMCGSQGTHRHCSKLKKNDEWTCASCIVEKRAESDTKVINGLEIIPIYQPSTSSSNQSLGANHDDDNNKAKPKKRKRHLRSDVKPYSNYIEIDSEDSDVVIIEDEPNTKCLIAQDRTLLKVHNNIKQTSTTTFMDNENQDSSSSCADFMNLVITDVRSLSSSSSSEPTKENINNYRENKKQFSVVEVASNEFRNIHNKILKSPKHEQQSQQQQQQQQQFLVLKEIIHPIHSIYGESNNQQSATAASSDDIVIID